MAEETGNLWSTAKRTAVAVIVAALVGGVITWIVGWLPAMWGAIGGAAAWTWGVLTFPVPVPAAVLAVLVLSIVVLIRRVRKREPAAAPPAARRQPAKRTPPALDETDLEILRLLADADGHFVGFEDAARRLNISRLVLERNCEALAERGLVEPHPNYERGLQIALTRAGRDFVIEKGFHLGL